MKQKLLNYQPFNEQEEKDKEEILRQICASEKMFSHVKIQ